MLLSFSVVGIRPMTNELTGYNDENIKIKIIFIPKGNSYCCRKSSARGPRFKVSSERQSAELTYHYGHPSKYKPRPMLLNLSVLGGWP